MTEYQQNTIMTLITDLSQLEAKQIINHLYFIKSRRLTSVDDTKQVKLV